MKKVLIITYYWPPSGGAGVQRMLKFVKYFSQFGIEPIVITVDEKKASYQLTDSTLLNDIPKNISIIKTNTFEPFEIYKLITNKKEIPHSGFANEPNPGAVQKVMRFIRGNFFIPDPRRGWNSFAIKAASKIIETEKIEAILTSSPPHSTQLIGLKLKKKYNLPWIADLRDPWTDIYFYDKLFHTTLAKRIDENLEKKVLENADAVLVVSQDIKRIFSTKSKKIDANKISVIPNGFDEDDFTKHTINNSEEFSITYTGTFADMYKIDGFLAAFKRIIDLHPTIDIKLKFIGLISNNLPEKIEKLALQNYVSFQKHIPHKEAVKALQESTMLLLVIPNIEKNEGILTGKLFEYLGSGKPILCVGPPKGDAAVIIDECEAGKVFDYDNENEMFNFIEQNIILWKKKLLDNLPNTKVDKYSRKKLTQDLADIIREISDKSNFSK